MNVAGCIWCVSGAQASVVNLGGGTGALMTTTSSGGLGCPLNWNVTGATPFALGAFAIGFGTTSLPLTLILPGCPGTIHTPSPVLLTALTDVFGAASIDVAVPPVQGLCGAQLTAQHIVLAPGACWLVPSDALAITIGN
jgi:hypothetical protein